MDPPLKDSTIFIDVAEGNGFSGLLDNFAKELQNENLKISAIREDLHEPNRNSASEIKRAILNNDGDFNNLLSERDSKIIRKAQSIKSGPSRIRCPECQKYTAADEEQLSRHIRKVHRGENPFLCYMCDYSTYNKVLFEEHVRIHQNIKPYKCSFCPHKSVSKKNLKKHELIHRPDNPLKCSSCDYIAKHRKALAHHLKSFHPEEDNLKCVYCRKQFVTMIQLDDHIAELKKCNECDYVTCSTTLLVTHKHRKISAKKRSKRTKDLFKCAACEYSSSAKSKILLHLIHHPKQVVDETIIDISILKKHGIM